MLNLFYFIYDNFMLCKSTPGVLYNFLSLTYSTGMYYSMQILLKHLLDTCYFLCRVMTEVTTWQNNEDNVIVQTGASPKPESLMTLAEITVKSIRLFPTNVFVSFIQIYLWYKCIFVLWQVKGEKCSGSAPSDPYVAFRKRTEKMQTRKNRKNDEVSYEKMLKLQRDLRKSVSLIQMVCRREKTKRELLNLEIEVFEKRWVLVFFIFHNNIFHIGLYAICSVEI